LKAGVAQTGLCNEIGTAKACALLSELRIPRDGAGDGTRTHDTLLGRSRYR
jgi:hypothetical protein